MKIGVLGCGAIGGLFLGYLSQAGRDVYGVVRGYQEDYFNSHGLDIKDVRTTNNIKVNVGTKLNQDLDLAIFASKINDLKLLVETNLPFLKNAVVLSTQNGIKADYILKEYFSEEKIITGIVMFGATFSAPCRITCNFPGDLIIGNIFNKRINDFQKIENCLSSAFNVCKLEGIEGGKYLKLLINLNNCIPACLGCSMQEAFGDLNIAKLAIVLNREAYRIITESGIKLVSLPAYPKERIEGLVSMDLNQAAGIFSKVMMNLSKEPVFGSVLQSINKGKPSEIDYLNGEVVRLAGENNLSAPLNAKIIELVHQVEGSRKFFNKDELLAQMEVN